MTLGHARKEWSSLVHLSVWRLHGLPVCDREGGMGEFNVHSELIVGPVMEC